MQDTGCLGLVHWDDPEGWYGEGGGRGVHDGEHVGRRLEVLDIPVPDKQKVISGS